MGIALRIRGMLCRFGYHHWRDTGIASSLLMPTTIQRCWACGVGRHVKAYSTEKYTKETMDEILARAKKIEEDAEKAVKEKKEKKVDEVKPTNKYNQYAVDRINAAAGDE